MRDAQQLASLLEIARHTLRQKLLPELEGERKFQAAMIANALAVAARSLDGGGEAEQEERAALRRLYALPEDAPPEPGELESLRRRLVDDLRRGRFDEAAPSLLQEALRRRVTARLSISNPAYSGTTGRSR
ncbi:DUF6285 domain-containing protein [Geminicoccaceae bacterium 1502E]|nr:DUF6285 domain-containing protein [Geminicoccaceae bacterium 1502E]